MSLPGGSVRLTFYVIAIQPASQPACELQLASQPAMWKDINLVGFGLVRHVVTGRVRLKFCVIGSQPACQLQLASQPAMWQDINLSDFGLVRYLVAGAPGAWLHWAAVQEPSIPTGSPWGVTYLTKARQVKQMSPTASYIHLALCLVTAVLYLCCLITYSCAQCREMLCWLCSLQTNLHIAFHHTNILLSKNYFYLHIWLKVSMTQMLPTCHADLT